VNKGSCLDRGRAQLHKHTSGPVLLTLVLRAISEAAKDRKTPETSSHTQHDRPPQSTRKQRPQCFTLPSLRNRTPTSAGLCLPYIPTTPLQHHGGAASATITSRQLTIHLPLSLGCGRALYLSPSPPTRSPCLPYRLSIQTVPTIHRNRDGEIWWDLAGLLHPTIEAKIRWLLQRGGMGIRESLTRTSEPSHQLLPLR